jgi:hypothetical protein
MSDFASDWAAALSWLYGGDSDSGGAPVLPRDAPVWPPHEPYVIVWCPHPRKPCRTGGVYSAPPGFTYVYVSYKRRKEYAELRDYRGPGWERGYRGVGGTLLTYPDGSKRDYGFVGPQYCRHGRLNTRPGTRPLHEVVADVTAGLIRRPASIVAFRVQDTRGATVTP